MTHLKLETRNLKLETVLLLFLTFTSLAQAQPSKGSTAVPQSATTSAATDFDKLVDEFFDDFFRFNPSFGTAAGFHQYDTQLEDYSRKAVDGEITAYQRWLSRFQQVHSADLPLETRGDLEMVIGAIRATLLELQDIRMWQRNPDRYSSGITNSVFLIMSRKFDTPENRLRSVIAREKKMPAVFKAARQNLENPPKIYTQVALEQIPGIVGFFQKDVPEAFSEVKDAKLLAEFKASNDAVIAELERYENFLKEDLLPLSKGDFRIGAENYRKKLLYEEDVDVPLDRLLEIGMENLRRNQQWFKETAAKIDPNKTPEQLLHEMQSDYPPPDKLMQTFRDMLGGIVDFINKKHIVTIPSPVPPIVEETPPFMRALTFASMDTPGPYEKVAKEAFFNVTLPEKDWKPEQVREHMSGFSRPVMTAVAIHEVYPGHYVQFLWVQHAPSKVRKLLGAGSNAEGWAHYCEQMMLDEGYGNGDPKLRLGQLQDALLRNARYIVGIQMHTDKMTFEEGVAFFEKEGYQAHAIADRETKRGTSDPTYLMYTLGKLEILKLREDLKTKQGNKFNLEQFHDDFLKKGFPPVKIIRREMLGDESPVL